MPASTARRAVLTVFMLALLVFGAHSWEAGLKFDAMTYAALAKNLLKTGDWKTLHYSREVFPDFYQHPPLLIWMQAVVFQLVGISDGAARILPALLGVATTGIVFAWANRVRGPWVALVAVLVLLSSGRYVKYATDLYLDGPLAFWLVLSAWCFFRSDEKAKTSSEAWLFAAAAGVASAGALLTKGIAGLSGPAVLLAYTILPSDAPRRFMRLGLSAIACSAVLGAWIAWGGGAEFLPRYWQESVAYRVGNATWESRLAPWTLLLRTWWPWLPLFVWAMIRAIPASFGADTASRSLRLALLGAFSIPVAFTVSGHALDHYMVPFFPFASLIVAETGRLVPEAWRPRLHEGIRITVVALAFALAILPVRVHLDRRPEFREFMRDLNRACPRAEIVSAHRSTGMDHLEAIARLAWYSDRDATFVRDLAPPTTPEELRRIVVVGPSLTIPAGYELALRDTRSGLRALAPIGLCD